MTDFDPEKCVVGVQHTEQIKTLFESHKHLEECVDKLTNHYAQRPTWSVSIIITLLVSLCAALLTIVLTK